MYKKHLVPTLIMVALISFATGKYNLMEKMDQPQKDQITCPTLKKDYSSKESEELLERAKKETPAAFVIYRDVLNALYVDGQSHATADGLKEFAATPIFGKLLLDNQKQNKEEYKKTIKSIDFTTQNWCKLNMEN